jgi:HEAT repeat protein
MTAAGPELPDPRLVDLASDAADLYEASRAWFLEQGAAAVPLLVRGLQDDRLGSVGHWRILLVLRELRRDEALPAIRAAFRRALDRRDPIVLPGAMEALARFSTPETAAELIALLGDPDADLVKHAAALLGLMGDPAAVGPLARLLEGENASIRFAAARALVQLNLPDARAALERHLPKEPDAEVRAVITSGS